VNYIEMDIDKWSEMFDPIMEDEGQERRFHWAGKDKKDMDAILAELEPDPEKRFLHVWTINTDDFGRDVISSGYRTVNRIDYIVTRKKWADDINSKLLYNIDFMGALSWDA
jgi:hypothetical protein